MLITDGVTILRAAEIFCFRPEIRAGPCSLKRPFFERPSRLGALVARDRDAYVYLAESIRKFPPQDELAAMLRDVNFGQVGYCNLSGGITAIHSAWRL